MRHFAWLGLIGGMLLIVRCSSGGSTTADGGGADAAVDEGPDDGIPLPKNAAAMEGLSIAEVSLYQTLRVPFAKDGKEFPSNIAVIANKEALLRVFVKPEAGWSPREVVAALDINAAGADTRIKTVATPSAASTEDAIDSTINFKIPKELMTTDASFVVTLFDASKMGAPTSDPIPQRYPMDGSLVSLRAQDPGPALRITLVPMKYNADGSGRLPDTSQEQLDVYRNIFYSMFPVPEIEITLHAAINCPGSISPGGGGWNSALGAVANLRMNEGAPAHAYYYGVFEPNATLAGFCGNGCVAGLSLLAQDPMDTWAHAGVGLGYGGAQDGFHSAYTAAHEIGHQHGRNHAPCGGAQGVDPFYPYTQGNTNTVGYALTDLGFQQAGTIIPIMSMGSYVKDIMGYCEPKWISDYTYRALFTRAKIINGAAIVPGPMRDYRWSIVDENNAILSTFPRVRGNLPPGGEPRTIAGKNGWFYPYDHVSGGMFLALEP